MKRVAVLLADGFEEIEAITPIDLLRRADFAVDVLSVSSGKATGAHGIVVAADCTVADYPDVPDAIVVPGGMPGAQNIADSPESIALIRSVSDSGGIVAAICAAPAVVLARYGFLDGKRATCYPGFESRFNETTQFSEERVVVDGSLITSRGAGTAAEFALELISRLGADDVARDVAERILLPRRSDDFR